MAAYSEDMKDARSTLSTQEHIQHAIESSKIFSDWRSLLTIRLEQKNPENRMELVPTSKTNEEDGFEPMKESKVLFDIDPKMKFLYKAFGKKTNKTAARTHQIDKRPWETVESRRDKKVLNRSVTGTMKKDKDALDSVMAIHLTNAVSVLSEPINEDQKREYGEFYNSLKNMLNVPSKISKSAFFSFYADQQWKVDEFVLNRIFSMIVFQQNKFIDIRDYASLMNVLIRGTPENKLKLCYAFYDFDDDGIITTRDVFLGLQYQVDVSLPQDFSKICHAFDPIEASSKLNQNSYSSISFMDFKSLFENLLLSRVSSNCYDEPLLCKILSYSLFWQLSYATSWRKVERDLGILWHTDASKNLPELSFIFGPMYSGRNVDSASTGPRMVKKASMSLGSNRRINIRGSFLAGDSFLAPDPIVKDLPVSRSPIVQPDSVMSNVDFNLPPAVPNCSVTMPNWVQQNLAWQYKQHQLRLNGHGQSVSIDSEPHLAPRASVTINKATINSLTIKTPKAADASYENINVGRLIVRMEVQNSGKTDEKKVSDVENSDKQLDSLLESVNLIRLDVKKNQDKKTSKDGSQTARMFEKFIVPSTLSHSDGSVTSRCR